MKVGTKVTWTRRNGEPANGKTKAEEAVRGKGTFIEVEYTDEKGKGTGKLAFVRPSLLSKR